MVMIRLDGGVTAKDLIIRVHILQIIGIYLDFFFRFEILAESFHMKPGKIPFF